MLFDASSFKNVPAYVHGMLYVINEHNNIMFDIL